jgi:hypothetical protein
MRWNGLAALLIVVLLAACVSEEEIAQSVNETLTAVPTITNLPTHTYYPTHTKYPTITPSQTKTFTPTLSDAQWETGGPIIDSWFWFSALLIDPQTPTTLYASVAFQYIGNLSPLYKSTDGGLSWKAIGNGLKGISVSSMVMDPITTSTLYIGTREHGAYKSEDSGMHWFAINNGLGKTTVVDMDILSNTPETIYAISRKDMYISENKGANWRLMETGMADLFSWDKLVIDPITPSTLYSIHSNGDEKSIWKSTNGGNNWVLFSDTAQLGKIFNFIVDTADPKKFYISGEYGIAKSINDGKDWEIIQFDVEQNESWKMALEGDAIYSGFQGYGIMKSINGGKEWIALGLYDKGILIIAIDPNPPHKVYAATYGGVFYQIQ